VNDLDYDIEQLWIEGMNPRKIATELNCGVELVQAWIKNQNLSETEDVYDPYATINS
jgi:uncharacterized protein YjcR